MLAVAVQASAASAEKAEGIAQTTGPWRWATTLSATPATPALRANPPSAWPDLLTLAQQAAGNRAAQAGAQAAQALSDQARATAWMPRVDATASTLRTHQSVNDVNVSTPTRTATLTATLPLWRAADRASARAQAQQAEQAQWQARLSQTTVAQDLSLAYLNAVEAAVPPSKVVHAILDNDAVHKHPKVCVWLDRHPRWRCPVTPTSSASWLNPVEG